MYPEVSVGSVYKFVYSDTLYTSWRVDVKVGDLIRLICVESTDKNIKVGQDHYGSAKIIANDISNGACVVQNNFHIGI